jgi:hypothetical protein
MVETAAILETIPLEHEEGHATSRAGHAGSKVSTLVPPVKSSEGQAKHPHHGNTGRVVGAVNYLSFNVTTLLLPQKAHWSVARHSGSNNGLSGSSKDNPLSPAGGSPLTQQRATQRPEVTAFKVAA